MGKQLKLLVVAPLLVLFPLCGNATMLAAQVYTGSTGPALSDAASDYPMLSDAGMQSTTDGGTDDEDLPFMDDDDMALKVYDPLETINRGMFWFNDKMYFYVIKPIARGLRYLPEPWRISLRNFVVNLRTPLRAVNAGLQGKFADAGNEITRFATNTTLGIGGLFDPAKEHFGISPTYEDTGQTFGYYGIGSGPYLVLPFLGPSNLRDFTGLLLDYQMDLAYYVWGKDRDNFDYLGVLAFHFTNKLSLDKDTYEGIKKDTLDPYLFIRDAYEQHRRHVIDN